MICHPNRSFPGCECDIGADINWGGSVAAVLRQPATGTPPGFDRCCLFGNLHAASIASASDRHPIEGQPASGTSTVRAWKLREGSIGREHLAVAQRARIIPTSQWPERPLTPKRHAAAPLGQDEVYGQAAAVRDCADRNGGCWDFGAIGRRRGSWRRSRRMLLPYQLPTDTLDLNSSSW